MFQEVKTRYAYFTKVRMGLNKLEENKIKGLTIFWCFTILSPQVLILFLYASKVHPRFICTIFVNDGLICSDKNIKQKDDMINRMKLEFEVIVTYANVYVGLHIHQDHTQQKLWISQALYVSQILKWFGFEHVTLVNTLVDPNVHLEHSLVDVAYVGPFSYSQAMGCFLCAQIGNKPNISYDVSSVAKLNHQPCIMELFAIFLNTSLITKQCSYGFVLLWRTWCKNSSSIL